MRNVVISVEVEKMKEELKRVESMLEKLRVRGYTKVVFNE